jgi:serine/threonine-protein kinase
VSDPLVGATVDTRYELRRLIAGGGMGLVFEAHHKFTRRLVALKLLPSDLRAKREARGRLMREAIALTTVRHPGFVEALDAGVCAEHGPYIVLEMLEGRTLDGVLASRQRLPIADTVHVARQICEAIAHAHARGVVHRDLKPSNVFLAQSEVGGEMVKLIDLGVAAVADYEHEHPKLTQAREVIGTPEYMAPEQLWARAVDARADVYAIGMTLFECLTGEVPYPGAYPDVLVQVSNAVAPPSVRQERPDVPAALALVIETALEKDVAARFQSAAELGRALVAASGLAPGRSSLLAPTADDAHVSPGAEPAAKGDGAEPDPERAIRLVRRKAASADGETGIQPSAAPSVPPSQRRSHARAPYVTPVLLVSPTGSEIKARSEEISEEGMLVVTPLAFPLGAPFEIRFASPMTGEEIVLDGRVRWTREGRGRSAMGLEFANPPLMLRGVVAQYIATIPAAAADV